MEEMLLRVCVVVFSLLYIKDHTVIQEQEEKLLMDLHEREYLLQNEAVQIEQEVQQMRTELPYSNQEVSQSHGRFTKAGGEDSNVQYLENVKEENPHEHQMPDGKDWDNRDIQKDEVPSTENTMQSKLQNGAINGEETTSNLQNEIKSVQEDDRSGYKKKGPHGEQEIKTVDKEQITDNQAKSYYLNGQKSSKLHQVEEMFDQSTSQEISKEIPTASSEQSTEKCYIWYFWKFISLISLIRIFRKFIFRSSQSSGTIIPFKDKTTYIPTGITNIPIPDHQVVRCFYDQRVRVSPGTCGRVCEFVEGLVDELLEAARDVSNKETDIQIGDFIRVGSLYELWAVGKTTVCDLYVPVTAPRSHEFDVELWKEKDASCSGFGKVKMMKVENISSSCPCMDGNPDNEDLLCLLHSHNETRKIIENAVGGPLCQGNTPYLSKKQVTRWFRTIIRKAWREISHKYEFELGFRNKIAPGAFRVRFRSGQTVLFNITPVVQFKASKVYLLSHLSTNQNTPNTHWPISFAKYEKVLLQYFNKTLADNSCHITCLQILSFLHKQQNSLTGKCGLTSYHLKSTLLHMLMYKPTEWKNEQLNDRLMDMLAFLEQRLLAKEFHHSLIGNPLVPKDILLPKEFQSMKPTNIFLPMILDDECYLNTVKHFQEMVKNTPIQIQEYGFKN
ncbi:Inositol 1,4,5-trisphosphate receptor-interacting protein [Bagarius yarrelli]|uniref:Inositol 1,4,5-trisphosphate receptor-interacting protein n=1 Tax=Bagarius yarrelli TaxID=175774 RepID=A0A556TKK7_BAGYA|nr:Inositol 1,4,5-trisphosphate receptor-interacting protein [Bagarius yarrelli]